MNHASRPIRAVIAVTLLISACTRAGSEDSGNGARVARPSAAEIAEKTEAARTKVPPLPGSALLALRRLLAVVEKQEGRVEIGLVQALSSKPKVGVAPLVEIRFDAIAHGEDSVAATAAFERFLAALGSAEGCAGVDPAPSTVERGPNEKEQVRIRGAKARFRLPEGPVELSAKRSGLQSLAREAAVRDHVEIGDVELVPREVLLNGGLVDVELSIRPLGKRTFPIANVLSYCEALESEDPGLRVTEIDLRPSADTFAFECKVTRRETRG
jgi:hypothetical protein